MHAQVYINNKFLLAILFNFRVGHCAPHVVDVDWRLDYYIKVQLQVCQLMTVVCEMAVCLLVAE